MKANGFVSLAESRFRQGDGPLGGLWGWILLIVFTDVGNPVLTVGRTVPYAVSLGLYKMGAANCTRDASIPHCFLLVEVM